jgi:hypothetical protein
MRHPPGENELRPPSPTEAYWPNAEWFPLSFRNVIICSVLQQSYPLLTFTGYATKFDFASHQGAIAMEF